MTSLVMLSGLDVLANASALHVSGLDVLADQAVQQSSKGTAQQSAAAAAVEVQLRPPALSP